MTAVPGVRRDEPDMDGVVAGHGGPLYPLAGVRPQLGRGVFVAPTAAVIGDVHLADDVSVWFGAVLRGDVGGIRIGARSNLQDLVCIHMTQNLTATSVGADCTVGHGAILHGCTIGDGCLIGMGAIVLDGAVIGERSVVAAGAVVTARTVVPPRSFVAGMPARVLRPVTDEQAELGVAGAAHYVLGGRRALAELWARRSAHEAPGATSGDLAREVER